MHCDSSTYTHEKLHERCLVGIACSVFCFEPVANNEIKISLIKTHDNVYQSKVCFT